MKIKLLQSNYQTENFTAMKNSYEEFLREVRLDPVYSEAQIISESTKDFLDNHIVDQQLNEFSGLKFYWATLLEKLLYLDSLHEEYQTSKGDVLMDIEDDIFDFWNKSEYMQAFLELMEESSEVLDNSLKLIPMLENQLVSFFILHIGQEPFDKSPVLYNILPEIGDTEEAIYVGEELHEYRLPKDLPLFPSLAIKSVDKERGEIILDKDVKLARTSKAIDLKHPVKMIPFHKNIDRNKDQVERALDIIQDLSPELYQTFCQFTKVIVPSDDAGIVSYSMQELPGYSTINLFDRDFVDLLDDLLHENGHHYLNSILNSAQLINEDDEMIYYSPWRKSRRPIRGIYHAYFTFYWALLLFNQLTEDSKDFLNSKEMEKARVRFCEEYLMLDYCWPDLLDAKEQEKMEKEGMEIIQPIQDHIDSLKGKFDKIYLMLENGNKRKIDDLRTVLKEERKKNNLF